MSPNDPRQLYLSFGAGNPSASPIARVLGALAGAAMFVLALIVGGVLLLAFLALATAVAAAVAVRFWWWRRQALKQGRSGAASGPGVAPSGAAGPDRQTTIEGDYRVIDE